MLDCVVLFNLGTCKALARVGCNLVVTGDEPKANTEVQKVIIKIIMRGQEPILTNGVEDFRPFKGVVEMFKA